jgi:hypothetical protein
MRDRLSWLLPFQENTENMEKYSSVKQGLMFLVLSRDSVTIDDVWIGNWIN